jgi:hypothetical protein
MSGYGGKVAIHDVHAPFIMFAHANYLLTVLVDIHLKRFSLQTFPSFSFHRKKYRTGV